MIKELLFQKFCIKDLRFQKEGAHISGVRAIITAMMAMAK